MNSDEVTKLEIDVLLVEYGALKTEIVANLNSARQTTGLTMTAVGALLASSPFIVSSNATLVLLIAPVFFYLLACTQLRYVWLVLDMGRHIQAVLEHGFHERLAILERRSDAVDHNLAAVLSWETAGSGLLARFEGFKRLIFIPIAGANFGVPLLAGMSSAIAYFVLPGAELGALQIGLATVDVAGCVYCGYWGWQADKARSTAPAPRALPSKSTPAAESDRDGD